MKLFAAQLCIKPWC